MVMSIRKYWKIILITLLLLAAAIVGWRVWQAQTPEGQVRRQLRQLVECVSKKEGEGTTAGLLKGRAITELFAPECTLEFRSEMFCGTYTPSEITADFARFRVMFAQVEVGMRKLAITFSSPTEAAADFTGHLIGTLKTGGTVDAVRELVCHLRKIEGEWKITAITVREILER